MMHEDVVVGEVADRGVSSCPAMCTTQLIVKCIGNVRASERASCIAYEIRE